jgi:hypothetical protein
MPSIEELGATIQADDIVLAYVVRTCKSVFGGVSSEPHLEHTGSGPNIEGGRITLCTCKHKMRTSPVFEEKNAKSRIWIAGFSSSVGVGENWLFYLMRVGEKFDSQKQIYERLQASPDVLKAKLATKNELGDIFEPKTPCHKPLDPGNYRKPHASHSHIKDDNWKRDIYSEYNGRHPKMLLGEDGYSYCYPIGKILLDARKPMSQGYRRLSGCEFLSRLKYPAGLS